MSKPSPLPFELLVAGRYLREGGAQTLLILLGVAVGVAVMVFLTALLSGLQASLIDKTLGSQAHILVRAPEREPTWTPPEGVAATARREKAPPRRRTIVNWPSAAAVVERVPGVAAVSPEVAGSAFASRGDAARAVALRGVDPPRFDRIVPVSRALAAGRFDLVGAEAAIGVGLADQLGVWAGDKLRLVNAAGAGEVFLVAGVFDLGNSDVNERWVLVPLRPAQALLGFEGEISTLAVRVTAIFAADEIAAAVAAATGLEATSWMTQNRQLMIGLRSQSSSGDLIQLFVIVAVALGIASVLAVSVVQKQREIGILRAFGTTRGQILRVFLLQGAFFGLGGSLLGGALGVGLAEVFASMAKNPDGSPTFPVDVSIGLVAAYALLASVTGLLAAILPARRAARLDPAVAIRHG